MKFEEGALALLAVASSTGPGGARALASGAAALSAAAPCSGMKDTPRLSSSLLDRVLGCESSRGRLGCCYGRGDAASLYPRRVRSRHTPCGDGQQGGAATETGRRRRSAMEVRGGAVVSDPYNARMQVMITRNMRKVLVEELGYLAEEVDDMDPQIAAVVIEKSLPRPRAGMPIAWRRSLRQRNARGPFFLSPIRLVAAAVEAAAGTAVKGAVAVAAFPFVAVGKGFAVARRGGARGAAVAVLGLGVAAVMAVLVASSLSGHGGADGMSMGIAGFRPLGETLAAAKARLPALKGKGGGALDSSTAAPGARQVPGGGGGGGSGATAAARRTALGRRRRGQRRRPEGDSKGKGERAESGLDGSSGSKKKDRAPPGKSSASQKVERHLGQTQHQRRQGRDGGRGTVGSRRKSKRRTGESRASEGEEASAVGAAASSPSAAGEGGAPRFDDLPPTPSASRKTGLTDESMGDEEGEELWEEPGPPHRWGRTPMDEHIPSEEEMEAWEDAIREPDSWLDRRINKVVGSLFGRGARGEDENPPPR